MRYLTKEHFIKLNDLLEYDLVFDIIEDKDYSEEEIKALYESTKEESLAQMEEYYNTEPILDNLVEELDLELEDVMIGDVTDAGEETNLRHPESWEEFTDLVLLENELGKLSENVFIYACEVYDIEGGYEIHFLLDTEEGYKNQTLRCTNYSAVSDEKNYN